MTSNQSRLPHRSLRSVALTGLALLLQAALSGPVQAESQDDLLVFLSVEGMEILSANDASIEGFDAEATADFLYSYNSDHLRFLAEYIWSSSESELERLQLAWKVDDATIIWLGRFHAISKYWTTEYHHGQFMQTSISRPGVEEWEDESGPMPSHVTGLLFEREFAARTGAAINLGLSAGIAPKFSDRKLIAFDVLDPESDHEMAYTGRLVYRPDVLSTNQVGVALTHNDIVVDSSSNPALADLNSIQQSTLSLFSNWSWRRWRLVTNWVFFDIEMRQVGEDVQEDFTLGYVQAEYEASEDWTVFSRIETGFGEDRSAYLQLLPAVIAHRTMLGVRWNIADSHALTLEVADTSYSAMDPGHTNFKEIRFQWSAVFP